jgi:hypothetical protein
MTFGTFRRGAGVVDYYHTNSSTLQVANMNALRTTATTPSPNRPFVRVAAPAEASRRAVYRERAPGVGYGNSSGYASDRIYARGWDGQPHFRCG